jgi:hypothetical protein
MKEWMIEQMLNSQKRRYNYEEADRQTRKAIKTERANWMCRTVSQMAAERETIRQHTLASLMKAGTVS